MILEIDVLFDITSAANTLPSQSLVFNNFCHTTQINDSDNCALT